jgi:protein SCO1/2
LKNKLKRYYQNSLSVSIVVLILSFSSSCNQNNELPIYGNRDVKVSVVDGKEVIDTIYATVPNFTLINQNGDTVTESIIEGKITVVDFFFTSCPTICPIMKREMIRVYQEFQQNEKVVMLSHTIDPEHDTIEVLQDYSRRLGSDGKQWQFLTGERTYIYELAEKGYYSTAMADSTEPGGFVHSGGLILIDEKKRVRGIFDGTNSADTDKLIEAIHLLLNEDN